MYVDQEALQDEEENQRTGANRPPTAGTDVWSASMSIAYSRNFM
jgi:hypothetical protein